MLLHVTLLFLSTMVLQNAASGVHVWKAADLKTRAGVLSQKLSEQKAASETLATEGNRSFMLAHREGPGLAEWHETQADVMFILSGNVTMVYGGTMVEAKTTAPGEMRGPSIRDGIEVKLGPGDVLHIPAKTPHQMKLDAGSQVTYFVTKVSE
jgi:mannose-6-phosphate isomerase-like protein (cupin superfamily)